MPDLQINDEAAIRTRRHAMRQPLDANVGTNQRLPSGRVGYASNDAAGGLCCCVRERGKKEKSREKEVSIGNSHIPLNEFPSAIVALGNSI